MYITLPISLIERRGYRAPLENKFATSVSKSEKFLEYYVICRQNVPRIIYTQMSATVIKINYSLYVSHCWR